MRMEVESVLEMLLLELSILDMENCCEQQHDIECTSQALQFYSRMINKPVNFSGKDILLCDNSVASYVELRKRNARLCPPNFHAT